MNKFLTATAAIALLGLVFLVYAFLEAHFMRVKKITVYSKKLPKSFDGFKIAFASDIHNVSAKGGRVRRMVKKINAQNPDIVLFGGDYNGGKAKDMEVCFKELSGINAPKYGVLGNHDYYYGEENAAHFMEKHGIESINNRSFWLAHGDENIKIGGLDDWWLGYPYPESFYHDLTPNDFSVLVCHNPDFFEESGILSHASLALAGHHHGGQCSFFRLWAPAVRSDFGLKYCGKTLYYPNTTVVCSNGIGTSHIPVRFAAIPEINLITLRSEENFVGKYKNTRRKNQ